MYADDSTIGANGKTIKDPEVKLNPDMAMVNNLCKDNKKALNCDKTKVILIIFNISKRSQAQYTSKFYICTNTQLENVNSNKLLVVIIDKNLTWKFHIVINKTAKSI